uniref:Uncharacterized protein n=1 Tax=Romanomermis culicivorax TaxID=13658 RepID=A0A915J8D1_ROMCU
MNGNDFEAAEYLLKVHGNLTLLKCESRTNPNHFWLFKNNKTKQRFDGLQAVYYGCNNCAKLGREKRRVVVRDGQVRTFAAAGSGNIFYKHVFPTVSSTIAIKLIINVFSI